MRGCCVGTYDEQQSLAHYPGFETFRSVMASEIFQDTIKLKITQSLSECARLALSSILADN
jgi:hypothetical protein